MQSWQNVISLGIIVVLIGFALWHGTPTDALLVLIAGLANSPFAAVFKPKPETTFVSGVEGEEKK